MPLGLLHESVGAAACELLAGTGHQPLPIREAHLSPSTCLPYSPSEKFALKEQGVCVCGE